MCVCVQASRSRERHCSSSSSVQKAAGKLHSNTAATNLSASAANELASANQCFLGMRQGDHGRAGSSGQWSLLQPGSQQYLRWEHTWLRAKYSSNLWLSCLEFLPCQPPLLPRMSRSKGKGRSWKKVWISEKEGIQKAWGQLQKAGFTAPCHDTRLAPHPAQFHGIDFFQQATA